MKHFLFLCSLFLITSISAQNTAKPSYGGVVTFATGGFGGYNYPVKGDSVLVYIKDNNEINFVVFPKTNLNNNMNSSRHLDIIFKDLALVKKTEYENIVTPDKTIPTGNYDMKFSYPTDKKNSSFYTASLTHFGDGNAASLTVIGEDGAQLRVNDLLMADLIKIK